MQLFQCGLEQLDDSHLETWQPLPLMMRYFAPWHATNGSVGHCGPVLYTPSVIVDFSALRQLFNRHGGAIRRAFANLS